MAQPGIRSQIRKQKKVGLGDYSQSDWEGILSQTGTSPDPLPPEARYRRTMRQQAGIQDVRKVGLSGYTKLLKSGLVGGGSGGAISEEEIAARKKRARKKYGTAAYPNT